jgi:hypothetical protein
MADLGPAVVSPVSGYNYNQAAVPLTPNPGRDLFDGNLGTPARAQAREPSKRNQARRSALPAPLGPFPDRRFQQNKKEIPDTDP